MALDIQFVDSTGEVQAVLPLEAEVFGILEPFLTGYHSPARLGRLCDCRSDVIWNAAEAPGLRKEVCDLHHVLQTEMSAANEKAREFLWRFEQFLRRAELQNLQIRALADA